MIEHYETEFQCSRCGQCKPASQFSPDKRRPRGYHAYCKPCRSISVNAARARKCKRRNSAQREVIWPRSVMQGLLDVNLRKWARVEVETNPRFGVAMIKPEVANV